MKLDTSGLHNCLIFKLEEAEQTSLMVSLLVSAENPEFKVVAKKY